MLFFKDNSCGEKCIAQPKTDYLEGLLFASDKHSPPKDKKKTCFSPKKDKINGKNQINLHFQKKNSIIVK